MRRLLASFLVAGAGGCTGTVIAETAVPSPADAVLTGAVTVAASVEGLDTNNPGSTPVDATGPAEWKCGPKPGVVVAGVVTNMNNPTVPGPGIAAVWSYKGRIGTEAGTALCQDIGADHVCEYEELAAAGCEQPGLADQTFWLIRNTTVMVDGVASAPGPGGRCHDWTSDSGCHGMDGEYGTIEGGVIRYVFDPDTAYDDSGWSYHGNGLDCYNRRRSILCCAHL